MPAKGEFQHPLCIAGNGIFEFLERGCRLIKRLYYRHSPDILHRSVVHFFQGLLVFAHVFFHFTAAKADKLCDKCKNDADQGGQTKPPVNSQQDDDHDDRSGNRGNKIRKLVSNKALHTFNVFIHDFPQTAAANRQVIPQWDFGNMVCKENFQLVQRSKCRHV